MNIYPQDLGTQEEQGVRQSRDAYALKRGHVDFYDASSWPSWVWRGVAAGVAGPILSLMAGVAFQSAEVGSVLFLVSVSMAVAVALMRRDESVGQALEQRPLTVSEIRDIKGSATDSLKRPFLELVMAAINTPPPPDVESQKSVREAIRTLGESIAGLPLLDRSGTQDDPAAFLAEAEKLGGEAASERDPVIAASLRRRADALHRQAETAERANTLLRRNEALRQEIAGQIAALQTSLTALRVGGAQAVYELADVAANIQQVAIEAGALTQARSEIGDM